MSSPNLKSGSVGRIWFPDSGIYNKECIVKIDTNHAGKIFNNLYQCNSIIWNRRQIRQLEINFDNLYRGSHTFAECYSLQRAYVSTDINSSNEHFEKYIDAADKNGYKDFLFKGVFRKLITSSYGYSYSLCKYWAIEFPMLSYSYGDFRSDNLKFVYTNLRNVVCLRNTFEGCPNLTRVILAGSNKSKINTNVGEKGQGIVRYSCAINDEYAKYGLYGFANLVVGAYAFKGCSKLKEIQFVYNNATQYIKLYNLLTGVGMFDDCKLNANTVKSILNSLPDINHWKKSNNGIICENKIYKELLGNTNKNNKTEIVKQLDTTKTSYGDDLMSLIYVEKKSSTIYVYYRNCTIESKFEVSSNTPVIYCKKLVSSYGIPINDFGVIDIGCDENVKNSEIKESYDKAVSKGWTVNLKKGGIKMM